MLPIHSFEEVCDVRGKNGNGAPHYRGVLWNRGNLTVIDEHFADDYVGHSFTKIEGPEGVKQFVKRMRSAFPDFEYTIEDEIAEGDTVVQRWTARATHKGEFQGIPPTGRRGTVTGIIIYRLSDGEIIEGWTNADMLGLMQQLGVVPTPG